MLHPCCCDCLPACTACQDYGLGYCANSLSLGCDCLGHIHYFDGTLVNSKGQPVAMKNVVCMHEEDVGLLWKHVEYR
jgi:primary-amine oxidase